MRRRELIKSSIALTGSGFAAGLSGCTSGPENSGETTNNDGKGGGQVEMTMASEIAPGHIYDQGAKKFAKKVEEKSDGSINIEVSPGGAYGTNNEITELTRNGDLAMCYATGVMYIYASNFSWISHPFTVTNIDSILGLFTGDIGNKMKSTLIENSGLRWMGKPIGAGHRMVYSKKPWSTPEDGENKTLRSPPLQTMIDLNEIGFNTAAEPLPMGDIATSIEQGVVDAWENDVWGGRAFSTHEFTNYVGKTRHGVQIEGLYVNEDRFQELDKSYQDILIASAEEAGEEATEDGMAEEEKILEFWEGEGMEILDADYSDFYERVEPTIKNWFEDDNKPWGNSGTTWDDAKEFIQPN
jgi:TRAP-type C4-dicarboxylate transport system substrate-binding protein